jgi:anti-sigma factor RsiW
MTVHDDEHDDLQELLPWYVTGRLDTAEQARLEAHLEGCAECQDEVRFQRRLESEVARLPIDVEQGWARMRERLQADEPAPRRPAVAPEPKPKPRPSWLGWGVAASLAVTGGVSMLPAAGPVLYHALGAAPVAEAGNVVVIFRPETTEKAMREALRGSDARLVDGPTAADAYVLRVPAAERTAALARLRGRGDIVLAEPLDPGTSP